MKRVITTPFPLSVFSLCLAVLLNGCGQEQKTPEEHIQAAKDLMAQGNLREAQIELRNTLQQQPNNPQAHLLMAEMSMKIGNPQLAEVELKKARESGVAEEAIRVDLARALLMQGRVEEAIKAAQPGERDSAQNRLKLLDVEARALLALGHMEESCNKSTTLFQQAPDSVLALQGMARCALVRDKNTQQAEKYLRDALEKDPKDATTQSLVGGLAQMEGHTEEAIKSFKASLSLDPLQIATRTQLANILIAQERLDDAKQVIDEGMKLAATPVLIHLQALIEFNRENFPRTKELLVKVFKMYPDYMPAILLSGMTEYALSNNEQASKHLARYLADNPDSDAARRALAGAQLRQGLAKEAIETLTPLAGGSKPDSVALGLIGQAYQALGEHDRAIAALRKSAELEPQRGAAHTLMAMSYNKSGDPNAAVTELTAASRFDSEYRRASDLLIAHYLDRQQFDQALDIIAAAEKKRPDDPELYNQRGIAYMGKQDGNRARESFSKALAIDPAYLPAASGLSHLDIRQNRDFGSARKRFESVLAKDGGNAQAMVNLAKVAAMDKKDGEFLQWLRKAIETDRKLVEPRVLLVEHLLSQGKNQDALAAAHDALNFQPESLPFLKLLARTQLTAGETDNAIANFTKLVSRAPTDADAFYNLGLLQAKAGKWPAARESFTKALANLPNFVKAAEALAMLELGQSNAGRALQVARKLQESTPKSMAGILLEGDLYMRQKQYAEAARAFNKAFAAKPNSENVMKLHRALAAAGDAATADKRITAWLQANPKDSATRGYYASSLGGRMAYKQAAQQYELLLADNPRNPIALNDLAWVYSQLGDGRAISVAEQAVKLFPNNANAQDTLGWLLVERGKVEQGLQHLEKAAASSRVPDIHFHLASALARSGNKAKAAQILTDLLKANPDFPRAAEAKALLAGLR